MGLIIVGLATFIVGLLLGFLVGATTENRHVDSDGAAKKLGR